MIEMTKLTILLAKADIPFELHPWVIKGEPTIQIASPSKENCKVDAVCHAFSYGGPEGFLEILSDEEEDAIGWLTAEDAFKYFKVI